MVKKESNFLFHEVSNKEREKIKKQAKQLMDDFAKSLDNISDSRLKEPLTERPLGEREERGEGCLPMSRDIMFGNAPDEDGEFIVAEKGGWKE